MTDSDPLSTLKRLFTSNTTEHTETDSAYECRDCGAEFERQHTACLGCGSRSIEQANWNRL